jgi:hypothetical protein
MFSFDAPLSSPVKKKKLRACDNSVGASPILTHKILPRYLRRVQAIFAIVMPEWGTGTQQDHASSTAVLQSRCEFFPGFLRYTQNASSGLLGQRQLTVLIRTSASIVKDSKKFGPYENVEHFCERSAASS